MTTGLLLLLMTANSLGSAGPLQPGTAAKQSLTKAEALYRRGEFDQALKEFNHAVTLFPKWKTASGYRALCRWTLGDTGGARADAQLAASLDPNTPESFIARGKARLVRKEYDSAAADFAAAGKLNTHSAEVEYGLGSVASSRSDSAGSIKHLDIAISRDPQFAIARLLRGTMKEKLKDLNGAIADYDAALDINARLSWALYYRAKDRRELKQYPQALADFDKFLVLNPEHEDALYLRGNVRFLSGDYSGTIDDLTRVLTLNPRHALAYSNRGQARARRNDRVGALSDLNKAIELDPGRREKYLAAITALSASNGVSASGTQASETPEPDNVGATLVIQ